VSRAEGIEASSADVEGRISCWDLGLDIDFPPRSTLSVKRAIRLQKDEAFMARTMQELRQRELDRERRWIDSQELFSKMPEFEAR
jgi:hypothetical protein